MKKPPSPKNSLNFRVGVIVASALAITTLQPSVTIAASDPLVTATTQMADAAFPVLTSITDISSLTNKLIKLGYTIPAAKATSALDKGIDSFLAIPDQNVASFATALKVSYDGVSGGSCSSSIPIPLAPLKQWASSEAVQGLDPAKVKQLQDKFQMANQAVPKSTTTTASGDYSNICLPTTKEGLEVLWIGQTELTLNVPRPEARAFVSSASAALQSIPGSEFLRVYPEAKKAFSSNVDRKTALKFETNAKALEKAIQSDPRFVQRGLKI